MGTTMDPMITTMDPITTMEVTNQSIYTCHCTNYTMNNFTKEDGSGCISGDDICATCPDDKDLCVCEESDECEFINNIVKALATLVIVAIVASVVCFLCFVGGCIYCWCAGVMCCAMAAKRGGGDNYNQML